MALLLGACGRIGYEPQLHGLPDGPAEFDLDGLVGEHDGASADVDAGDGDAGADVGEAPPRTGPCDWSNGPPTFAPAQRVAGVNSSVEDQDPTLSPDELTLYFSSDRGGSHDIWVATRASVTQAFAAPTLFAPPNTESEEQRFFMRADALEALMARAGKAVRDPHLWRATRTTASAPFEPFALLVEVNSAGEDVDPFLEPDGLTLWFASSGHAGAVGELDLFSATRPDLGAPFGQPWPAQGLGSLANDSAPSLTADGLAIVFSTERAGISDVYYATRPQRGAPFGPPQPLAAINTEYVETDSFVTADGCSIYFASDRPDPTRGKDLWVVTAAPAASPDQ